MLEKFKQQQGVYCGCSGVRYWKAVRFGEELRMGSQTIEGLSYFVLSYVRLFNTLDCSPPGSHEGERDGLSLIVASELINVGVLKS